MGLTAEKCELINEPVDQLSKVMLAVFFDFYRDEYEGYEVDRAAFYRVVENCFPTKFINHCLNRISKCPPGAGTTEQVRWMYEYQVVLKVLNGSFKANFAHVAQEMDELY